MSIEAGLWGRLDMREPYGVYAHGDDTPVVTAISLSKARLLQAKLAEASSTPLTFEIRLNRRCESFKAVQAAAAAGEIDIEPLFSFAIGESFGEPPIATAAPPRVSQLDQFLVSRIESGTEAFTPTQSESTIASAARAVAVLNERAVANLQEQRYRVTANPYHVALPLLLQVARATGVDLSELFRADLCRSLAQSARPAIGLR